MTGRATEIWLDDERLEGYGEPWPPPRPAYGHFTAMQVRDSSVRGLSRHLARIAAATQELFDASLPPDRTLRRWRRAVDGRGDASLRSTYFADGDGQVRELVTVGPPEDAATDPLSLRTVAHVRPFAHLKHTGAFDVIAHWQQAERLGFDDALLTTPDGSVAETTIGNLGLVTDGAIVWPDGPSLHGVGQQLLEEALPAAGIPCRRETVRVGDLPAYDGAFQVNGIGVTPVRRIDENAYAAPARGVQEIMDVHAALPWDELRTESP